MTNNKPFMTCLFSFIMNFYLALVNVAARFVYPSAGSRW